jgi:methionine biosynthesis protein MetW
LLAMLRDQRGVRASGIELSQDGVNECVRKGLSVIQGDADSDLDGYISGVFDWVILSHTILSVQDPRKVLDKLTSIGRQAVVSIYNAAYWKDRWSFALRGRLPPSLPLLASWEDTRIVRRCSIMDFQDLCDDMKLEVRQLIVLDAEGRPLKSPQFQNYFGRQAVFVLARK